MIKDNSCSLRMQEYPDGPYEKALRYGVLCLCDEELLAILIRAGYKDQNALSIAHQLMQLDRNGLRNIQEKSIEELTRIKGVGSIKALTLKAACELGKRISKAERFQRMEMNSSDSIAMYYMEEMKNEDVEIVRLVFFNHRFGLLTEQLLSRGTLDASLVSIRSIFREGIRANASYVVILHNHPSGDPNPSREDYLVTEKVKKAGELLEIPLIDHIIIGDNYYYSFKEHEELSPREGT